MESIGRGGRVGGGGRNERVGQGHGCVVRTEFADKFDLLVYSKAPVDVGYCTP